MMEPIWIIVYEDFETTVVVDSETKLTENNHSDSVQKYGNEQLRLCDSSLQFWFTGKS